MDAKLDSAVKTEETEDKRGNQPKPHDSLPTASDSHTVPDNTAAGQTGISTV